MKRRILLLALALMLVLSGFSALADVQRGDRGEEVRYVQWQLFRTGWLFELPDGIFGKKTEQAVRDYQKYRGVPQTGIADDALQEMMEWDRVRLFHEIYGDDYYEAYDGDYVPPFPTGATAVSGDAGYVPPAHCQTVTLRALLIRDTCKTHLALLKQDGALTAQDDDAAGFSEASTLWLKDIETQYGAWIDAAPAGQKLDVLAAWTAWNASFGEQRAALYNTWNDAPLVERQMALMTKNYALTLCEILAGEMPVDPDMAYIPDEDGGDGWCNIWAESLGTEYLSICGTHHALSSREYEWTWQGGTDAQALEDLAADWDQALFALYDRWLALCDDAGDEAVLNARANFFHALTAQGIALKDTGCETLAHIRTVQYECARLCELFNHIQSDSET